MSKLERFSHAIEVLIICLSCAAIWALITWLAGLSLAWIVGVAAFTFLMCLFVLGMCKEAAR